MSRIYIGIAPTGEREIFRCPHIPSAELVDGLYVAAVGPFQTRAGAEFMRDHPNNPHCVSVGDAERLAAADRALREGGAVDSSLTITVALLDPVN